MNGSRDDSRSLPRLLRPPSIGGLWPVGGRRRSSRAEFSSSHAFELLFHSITADILADGRGPRAGGGKTPGLGIEA